jgi:hypothetical protein
MISAVFGLGVRVYISVHYVGAGFHYMNEICRNPCFTALSGIV